jgi:hypothetical protein
LDLDGIDHGFELDIFLLQALEARRAVAFALQVGINARGPL